MAESKYAKQVLKEPKGIIERDGEVIFDGIIAKPEQLGTKCGLQWSVFVSVAYRLWNAHAQDELGKVSARRREWAGPGRAAKTRPETAGPSDTTPSRNPSSSSPFSRPSYRTCC